MRRSRFWSNFAFCLAAKWRPKTIPEFGYHWGPTLQWRSQMLTGSLWRLRVSFLRFLCHFRRSSDQFSVNFRARITSPRPCLLDSFLKYLFCRNRDPTMAGRQTFKGRRLNTSQICTQSYKEKTATSNKTEKTRVCQSHLSCRACL